MSSPGLTQPLVDLLSKDQPFLRPANVHVFHPILWKSLTAGALGGLVGAIAMNQFQAAVSAIEDAANNKMGKQQKPNPEQTEEGSGDDATVKAAEAISQGIFQHDLNGSEKKWAGPAVHYAMGGSLGAAYGLLAGWTPVEAGAGTAFGGAVWLLADEIAVPFLGLAPAPQQSPLSSHAKGLTSHLVFGLVTHFTRGVLLRLLPK